MLQVPSLVAVLEVGVLAGCGEQTKRVAATPTPTRTAVTTAAATPEPAGGQPARERLARILSEDALDRGRSRRTEGRLALVRLSGCRNVLIWADDSRRLPGDIRASSPPAREMCTLWETGG